MKILNRSKFLYSRKNIYYTILFYRFFLYKGWLSQSYQFGKFINKQKNYELNASLRKKNSDKNFYKFISNKKVAIIGPSKTNSKNGEEIDKYDVVIRMGQIDSSSLSKKIKGLKTDIIYFNGDKTFDLIKKKKIDDVKKAKFLVFKSIGFVKLFKKVGLNNVRKASETDRFFRVGFSFGLPWIIHDVIKCNPKSIKIFDTDFLINPIRVKNYYQGGLKPKNYFLKILLQHDPISQFEFMKKLLKKYKIIHGDKNFNSIIKMSAQKYLSKLEYNYNLK